MTAPEAAPDATYGSASNVCAVAVEEPFWNDPSVSTIDALQGRAVVLHAIGTLDAAC